MGSGMKPNDSVLNPYILRVCCSLIFFFMSKVAVADPLELPQYRIEHYEQQLLKQQERLDALEEQGSLPTEPPQNQKPKVELIVVYNCASCQRAIDHMRDKKIPFTVKNIARTEAAFIEYVLKRQGRLPVVSIEGETVMKGFDPASFNKIYEAATNNQNSSNTP